MTAVLTFTDVVKSFKGRPVIEGASFEIHRGEAVALQGPNGSGKSVLFRLASKILKPDSGSVWIAPEFLEPGDCLPVGFGVIIDRPGFIPNRHGYENLQRLAAIRGVINGPQIEDAMIRVGLQPDLATPVGRYSLGMRQKLAIAQTFMEGQDFLILDEPFNGLDKDSNASIHQLLHEFHDEGRTIFFTSHNEKDIENLATRRLELNAGRIEQTCSS